MEKNRNILIIDDSYTNNVLLDAILKEKGYDIHLAYNGEEAHKILRKKDFSLILLDLLMPKVSGFDFLKEIKQEEDTKDIPVIVVSAVTDKKDIEKTLSLGANEYIKKPIDIHNIVNIVEKHMA
jgi:CheY-like chemotaxis protein